MMACAARSRQASSGARQISSRRHINNLQAKEKIFEQSVALRSFTSQLWESVLERSLWMDRWRTLCSFSFFLFCFGGAYGKAGKSVFFSVNSNERRVLDFSEAKCIVQLPPVWSNETGKFPSGEADLLADRGIRGKSVVWPVSVFARIIRKYWSSRSQARTMV
jgi:hypothetical protein